MEKDLLYQHKKIHYLSIGQGPTVLLLHGFGEDQRVWKEQAAFLQNDFHLLIPDLPGSGQSELIDDMSIDGMAEAIRSVLEKEMTGSGPVSIIAHSMGGYIALALQEKYPQHLNSLGLFHSTSYADTEEKKALRCKGIEFIKENGAFEFLKTTIPNLFSPISKQKMAPAINDFIGRQHNFRAEALVSYYEAMMARPDRRQLVKNSRLPFLFIMGKYDTAVPFSDSLQQCHLPEKSYIHILRQSGHMGMMEETGTANRILKNFLLQVQSRQ